LAGVFESGQAYVALSRLRGLQSLQLKDWNRTAIKSNERVAKFYASLSASKQNVLPSNNNLTNNNTAQITQPSASYGRLFPQNAFL